MKLQDKIRFLLEQRKQSPAWLTRRTGINISRLLSTDSSPQLSTLHKIARALSVPVEILVDPKSSPETNPDQWTFELKLDDEGYPRTARSTFTSRWLESREKYLEEGRARRDGRMLPIFNWRELSSPDLSLLASRFNAIASPIYCSSDAFAVILPFDCYSPAFNKGEILLVDPRIKPQDGSYIICREESEPIADLFGKIKTDEMRPPAVLFRKLLIENDQSFLVRINPILPNDALRLTKTQKIVGVVFAKVTDFSLR